MSSTVQAPRSLSDLRYFVLRYERESGKYELCLPDTAATHILGGEDKTQAYFWSVGLEALGHRAMDVARSFGTALANILENRAFAPDLCEIDDVMRRRDQELTCRRLLGDEDEDEVLEI